MNTRGMEKVPTIEAIRPFWKERGQIGKRVLWCCKQTDGWFDLHFQKVFLVFKMQLNKVAQTVDDRQCNTYIECEIEDVVE